MQSLGRIMGCACGKEEIIIEDRRFEIVKKIAEGGFSLIYLVKDTRSSKQFAAKRITCHSQREVELAKKELDLHLKLKNEPHIVSVVCHMLGSAQSRTALVYSAKGTVENVSELWMVMPFFKRGSLLDELNRRIVTLDHMSESRVLSLFLGVCRAVDAMHSLEPPMAHRDLKTGNVMLSDDGNSSVVIDLGSACVANVYVETNKQGNMFMDQAAEHSTMSYRPPELFNIEMGCSITEKSDIWSLGCVLYAMCFFKSPFDAVYERGDSVALAVAAAKINIPENSKYCEDLHLLIKSMIQTDPDSRPDICNVIASVHIIKEECNNSKNGIQVV